MIKRKQLNMQRDEDNESYNPLKDMNLMDDFLHYIERSSEDNVPEDCDERLKHLHRKLEEIKANEQMGVTYMKMEERDRLIRKEGELKGESKIISMIRKKLAKNKNIVEIAEELELENNYVENVTALLREDPDRTDEQVAEIVLYGKKNKEMAINIKVDYKAVEEVVRRAGMMMKEAHLSSDSVHHKEGAANFVTSYDVAIQKFLIEELHRIVPEAAFLARRRRKGIQERKNLTACAF